MYAKLATAISDFTQHMSRPVLLYCLVLGLSSAIIDIGLWSAGMGANATLVKSFFTLQAGDDSWMPMEAAYDVLTEPGGGELYARLFFEEGVKFQYPPTSLLPYKLSEALNLELTSAFWNHVSWGLAVSVAIAIALLGSSFLQRYDNGRTSQATRYLLVAMLGLITLDFFPLLRGYTLGQVQTLLTAIFTLACLFWLKGKTALSGAMIGLICLFKPQFGLFLIWSALRLEWRFVAGFMAAVIPLGVLSLAAFGLNNHLAYFDVLSHLARHGESFHANQSVNGLVHRLLGNGESLVWQPNGFPPYNAAVHVATFTTSLALIGFALFYRSRGGPANVMDFAAAGLAFTMASPIAWDHHYGALLPSACLVAATLLLMQERARKTVFAVLFFIAFIVASKDLSPLLKSAAPEGSLAFSYIFLAASILLALAFTLPKTLPATHRSS